MDFITLATSVTPDRSVGFTATVIIAGLGIVLGTLAVLILVFYAFGAIMSVAQKKSPKKSNNSANASAKAGIPAPNIPKSVPASANSSESATQGINPEVVAAISAAVYQLEGSNSVVTSITPISRKANPITSRNPWANAAVIDNTKPF